jgi:hypothetical protein
MIIARCPIAISRMKDCLFEIEYYLKTIKMEVCGIDRPRKVDRRGGRI